MINCSLPNVGIIIEEKMSKIGALLDRHADRLQALDELLDERQFEKASSLGYGDITYAFVFLQRTLAVLQSVDQDISTFTTDMAGPLGCAYEKVETDVKSRMFCYRPRREMVDPEVANWKTKNAQAIAETNEWVEQNGLPLNKFRPD